MRTRWTMVGQVCAATVLCLAPPPAHAGTRYLTSLVPVVAGRLPGFSAAGSSVKVDGSRRVLRGKIKRVVDGNGMPVSADNYRVEVDISDELEPALDSYDAVHLFNIVRPQEVWPQAKNAARQGKHIFLSTVYCDVWEFERRYAELD